MQWRHSTLYLGTCFSHWVDRMWKFAIGLYLVKLTPGSLQLAAFYGLVLSFSAILICPMIGEWIDRNPRLKVVRIVLFIQSLIVIACGILLILYICNITGNPKIKGFLKALIVLFGSLVTVVAEGEKIAVGKDWFVVISGGSADVLTALNTVKYRVDLLFALTAPMAVGLLMTFVSDAVGVIIICTWTDLSILLEYICFLDVYNRTPELAKKTKRKISEKPSKNETKCWDCSRFVDFFQRFKIVFNGWKVYKKQTVFLAGCAYAVMCFTLLDFGAVTLGYIYGEGLTEFYVSVFVALGNIFGLVGTFIFPRVRERLGLLKTGCVGFSLQWPMLLLCVISIWLPGSPSSFYTGAKSALLSKLSNHGSKVLGLANISPPQHLGMHKTLDFIDETPKTSIIVFMVGVVLSRIGKWMTELTILQLQQENVPEDERGIVGGVQFSFMCIMELARYDLSILLPSRKEFGILILISFVAIGWYGFIYVWFAVHFPASNSGVIEQCEKKDERKL